MSFLFMILQIFRSHQVRGGYYGWNCACAFKSSGINSLKNEFKQVKRKICFWCMKMKRQNENYIRSKSTSRGLNNALARVKLWDTWLRAEVRRGVAIFNFWQTFLSSSQWNIGNKMSESLPWASAFPKSNSIIEDGLMKLAILYIAHDNEAFIIE